MKVYKQAEITADTFKNSVCAIGNFDGVHKGHQKIFQLLEQAKQVHQAPSLVYTFEPHPVRVLNPGKGLKLIFGYDQKIELLRQQNPDGIIIAPFDEALAKMQAVDFVKQILVGLLKAKKVVVGYDFNFGRGGDGNAEQLTQFGAKYGFEVDQAPAVMHESRIISSSRIRRLVSAGELAMVHQMLGRPFFLAGTVVKGRARGGKVIGIPTANLSPQQEIIPAKGVYSVVVKTPQGIYAGAANVGVNPTFNNGALSIETHIIGFDDEIYGAPFEVHFLRRLRDEKKFDSVERLKEQMQKDIRKAAEEFATFSPETLSK